MGKKSVRSADVTLDPTVISRFKKERFVRALTEDEFRDKIVRPLFLRKGFKDGRELCGTQEEGKDTLFVDLNTLGMQQLWVVQTKRGNLNLSSKVSQNVVIAITQLRTALETKFTFVTTKKKCKPDYAILCASGTINDSAKKHICDEVKDPRVVFMDIDHIIPMIDEYYPEYWWGIDADRFPYLKNLRDSLIKSSDTITLSEVDMQFEDGAPITDEMYVPLYLHRLTTKTIKRKGQVFTEPDIEQIPIQGVLKRREYLIHIVGEAGTGKTTALRRFAYTIADRSLCDAEVIDIPIILKATQIAEHDVRMLNLLVEATVKYTGSDKPCFSEDDLNGGNVLLLVDALDEVADHKRPSVVSRLRDFHSIYQKCRIIITSRNYSTITNMHELNCFTRFTITPIDLKQAHKMLERLSKGKGLPVEQAEEILRQLHDVHGMELNPLLITVFLATSDYSRRDIPANITELFKKFTEMMLGRWDLRKGLSQQYQAVVKDFLLKRLSFHIHSNKETSISLSNCKEIFRQELRERGYEADLEVIFEEVVNRSGLFKVEEDYLSFRHVLLQEFFAGRGVPSPTFFQSVITDDWWKNPLVFYFGEHPDAHTELKNLIQNINGYNGAELYKASVALGLAIQACYLARISDKIDSMSWIIQALARSEDGFLKTLQSENPNLPLSAFLAYYIHARDSVACESIVNYTFTSAEKILNGKQTPLSSIETFWHLVSLIQSGSLDKADLLLKKFKPDDLRLLMALHLGCFLISNLRITSKADVKIANRMCDYLGPKINHLRRQVLNEFKSLLLEVRRGKIEALPDGKEDSRIED